MRENARMFASMDIITTYALTVIAAYVSQTAPEGQPFFTTSRLLLACAWPVFFYKQLVKHFASPGVPKMPKHE